MLAEWSVAAKRVTMRRFIAIVLVGALALAPAGCRDQPQGALKAIVIGGEPKLRDPALGALPASDAVLIQNVAQGLVRFDPSGNIVAGLAERWNVSDDGLSYIFRLATAQWPDGRKVTADQVTKLLKRQIAARSHNQLRDTVGAVQEIVAMTDRVIQIQLVAPRPNLLTLLAQPEFAILRGASGTGPFTAVWTGAPGGELRLSRAIPSSDDGEAQHDEALLAGGSAEEAIAAFARSKTDLVIGGSFIDVPLARRGPLPRAALRFDLTSGLFGLVPTSARGPLAKPEARHLLSQALDRANFVNALGIPGLAARATLLEPGLDGIPTPIAPNWLGIPLAQQLPDLRARSNKLFGKTKPTIRVALPAGPGADILLNELKRDWGAIGLTVEAASGPGGADFALIDEVAPSSSPAWFARRFHCGVVAVCDDQADQLREAARLTPVAAQRSAMLAQAASRIDELQLFIPLTAPVRWSLVSSRIQNFAGNRYARHTLTDLLDQPSTN